MRYKRKVSDYKIKKLLGFFLEDLTSTEAARHIKLSRNTTDRFYGIFREILVGKYNSNLKQIIKKCHNCLGFIETEYTSSIYKVYSYNDKLYLFRIYILPPCFKRAQYKDNFKLLLGYIYSRFPKFYGFTYENHYTHIVESFFRFYFSKEDIGSFIWNEMKGKRNKKNLLSI